MGSDTSKNIREFALIGFILLAVLFGMQIMTFIFGSLGSVPLEDVTTTVTNESISINLITGISTINDNTNINFVSWNATVIYNTTLGPTAQNNTLVEGTDYQIFSNNGTFGNVTGGWNLTNVTYSVVRKSEVEIVTNQVQNDSLRAIGNYATQSGTQFTTLGIAITLIILVAVFLFFWKAFMGGGKKGEDGPGGFT